VSRPALSAPHVLLVEDDRAIRQSTAQMLARDGFAMSTAASGSDGLAAFERAPPDLALLDIMLPDLDGVALCREIRQRSHLPIVFLSARSDPIDIVLGLEAGADDYVVKPFEPAVLAARLRAALRRASVEPRTAGAPNELSAGSVCIDLDGHTATRDGAELALTPTEFRLLAELALNAGIVLDRSTLLERVWGYSWSGDARLVDVHVQRLRAKVESDPSRPDTILTVRGVGYKLARPAAPPA
jgi:two-component system, OmpR family, response regulator MtrA